MNNNNKTAEEIVQFLVKNKIMFTSPGLYTISDTVVACALQEFIETGKSKIIEKHQKWTWGCWELESFRQEQTSLKDLEELKKLKAFWGDTDDIEFLDEAILETAEREKIRNSYAFRRKKEFTPIIKRACLIRDKYKCRSCGTKEKLEVDHIIELIDGGDNSLTNLQALCRKCHLFKTNSKRLERKQRYG